MVAGAVTPVPLRYGGQLHPPLWYEDAATCARVCDTLAEMIADRGFALARRDDELLPAEARQLREMPMVARRADRLMAAYFVPELKMSVRLLRKLVAVVDALDRLDVMVLVVHESVTHFALREQQDDHRIQIFKYTELLFNPTGHISVPRHEVVPADEVQGLLRRLQVGSVDQLPRVFDTDPVIRYHGWQAGQVVRIHRHLLGGYQHFYRLIRSE